MRRTSHHVRRLSVELVTADMPLAMALRERVETMARSLLPAVLERVFDTVAGEDRHIRIDRLDLDLGQLPAEGLEQAAAAALERVLTEALRRALTGADTDGTAVEARHLSPQQAQLELLDHYLAHGTLPYWARGQDAMAPAALLDRLMTAQPAAAAALLRRRGRDRAALTRLVLQAGEAGLRRLLALLAPAEAAEILAYLADLILLHQVQPLLPLAEPGLRRLLWLLTFDYLVREAGSQFNRRSFVASLLEGAAEAEGVPYAALLDLLRLGLEQLRRHRPLGSSLPGVLHELFAVTPRPPPPAATAAADRPIDNPDLLISRAEQGDATELLALMRRQAADRSAMERLVRRLPAPVFADILARLEPGHATLILAYLGDITRLHHEEAILTLSDLGMERLLRLLTLLHLLRDPGSQFNRRDWLRRLLQGMAAAEGIAYARLLDLLGRCLQQTGRHLPLASSLPALVAELIGEQAVTAPAPPAISPPTADLPESLERLLRREGEATGSLAAALADLSADALAGLVQRLAGDRGAVYRLAGLLSEAAFRRLAATLAGADAGGFLDTLDGLCDLHRHVPLLTLDDMGFRQLGRALMLGFMVRPGGRSGMPVLPWLLDGVARFAGLDRAGLLDILRRTTTTAVNGTIPDLPPGLEAMLQEVATAPLPGQALFLAGRYLTGSQSLASGAGLPALATQDPAGLAALLRRLAHADPTVWPQRLDRLLAWLLPEEVATLLDARQADEATRLAGVLADMPGMTLVAAWRRVLEAMLWDRFPPPLPPPLASPSPPVPDPPPERAARTLALAWLAGDIPDDRMEAEQLATLMEWLAEHEAEALREALARGLAQAAVRERWALHLADATLARLLTVIAPERARFLIAAGTVLATAWRETASPEQRAALRHLPWSLLLELVAERPPELRPVRLLAAELVQRLAGGDPARLSPLLEKAQSLARDGGHAGVTAALQAVPRPPPSSPPARPPGWRFPASTTPPPEPVYIGNAGLVLLAPFLPRFFQQLDLLTPGEDGKPGLHGLATVSRAVHLLQYLVDERCDRTEPELVLNKLLCGVTPAFPVEPAIEPTNADLALCGQLTRAVLANWTIIKDTSPIGLRQTFLQREGKLTPAENGWTLTVQRKTVDVLVDQIPWGFSIILHGWMTSPIHVTW